ncbi:hypothetical protein ADL00_24085 [Streptomyces sp. AS58]|nr:hypothetical protein [Streptomyces sp. AS58]KOV63008.1 hypothetical protein ADL00_24085 [Streptomyces sp. AS58]
MTQKRVPVPSRVAVQIGEPRREGVPVVSPQHLGVAPVELVAGGAEEHSAQLGSFLAGEAVEFVLVVDLGPAHRGFHQPQEPDPLLRGGGVGLREDHLMVGGSQFAGDPLGVLGVTVVPGTAREDGEGVHALAPGAGECERSGRVDAAREEQTELAVRGGAFPDGVLQDLAVSPDELVRAGGLLGV